MIHRIKNAWRALCGATVLPLDMPHILVHDDGDSSCVVWRNVNGADVADVLTNAAGMVARQHPPITHLKPTIH